MWSDLYKYYWTIECTSMKDLLCNAFFRHLQCIVENILHVTALQWLFKKKSGSKLQGLPFICRHQWDDSCKYASSVAACNMFLQFVTICCQQCIARRQTAFCNRNNFKACYFCLYLQGKDLFLHCLRFVHAWYLRDEIGQDFQPTFKSCELQEVYMCIEIHTCLKMSIY